MSQTLLIQPQQTEDSIAYGYAKVHLSEEYTSDERSHLIKVFTFLRSALPNATHAEIADYINTTLPTVKPKNAPKWTTGGVRYALRELCKIDDNGNKLKSKRRKKRRKSVKTVSKRQVIVEQPRNDLLARIKKEQAMDQRSNVTLRINDNLMQELRIKCVRGDVTITAVIETLIKEFLG